jgi:hypothetical protein
MTSATDIRKLHFLSKTAIGVTNHRSGTLSFPRRRRCERAELHSDRRKSELSLAQGFRLLSGDIPKSSGLPRQRSSGELRTPFLHLDKNFRLPNIICKADSPAVVSGLTNAEFRGTTNFKGAFLSEGLKETIKKYLCLPLFVAGDVLIDPSDELSQLLPSSLIAHNGHRMGGLIFV